MAQKQRPTLPEYCFAFFTKNVSTSPSGSSDHKPPSASPFKVSNPFAKKSATELHNRGKPTKPKYVAAEVNPVPVSDPSKKSPSFEEKKVISPVTAPAPPPAVPLVPPPKLESKVLSTNM